MIEVIKKDKHPHLYAIKIAVYSRLFPSFIKSGIKIPSITPNKKKGSLNAFYLSAFSNGNAGDTLLPTVLKDLIGSTLGIKKWTCERVHKPVTLDDVAKYNKNDMIIIGGGGLFLKDTNPNQNSGWQWNCSIEMLTKIQKPLIAFAIGYNRFRGQEDFEPIFYEHIKAFVKKAAFVGLRNHGSIRAVKNYLNESALKEKIVFQPCMTTLISYIYPNLFNYRKKKDTIAFNCAFDRKELRSLKESSL